MDIEGRKRNTDQAYKRSSKAGLLFVPHLALPACCG